MILVVVLLLLGGLGVLLRLSATLLTHVLLNRNRKYRRAEDSVGNADRVSFSKVAYTAEFLVNPLPLAILSTGASAALAPQSLGYAITFTAALFLLRCLETRILSRATGARVSRE